MAIVYRENKGAPLTVSEIDQNFRTLENRLGFIEQGQILGVEGIARVEQNGNEISFIGTQGSVFGPVQLSGGLSFKGDWLAARFYQQGDVVLRTGSSYVAIRPHTAAADFMSDLELERWMPLAYRGSDGERGSQWIIQYGHPSTATLNGFRAGIDIYLDALTKTVYQLDPVSVEWTEMFSISGASTASEVSYDASGTSLSATTVQDAINEIEQRLNSGVVSFDGGSF